MANTTSGTTTFEKGFSIDDIIHEAYERINMTGVTGQQLSSARRSLNIMFQEWSNRGLHYWEIKNNNLTLVQGQNLYTMYRSPEDGTSDANAIYGVDDILDTTQLIDDQGNINYDRINLFSAVDYGFIISYARKMLTKEISYGINTKIIMTIQLKL